jgi:hypothetical protein
MLFDDETRVLTGGLSLAFRVVALSAVRTLSVCLESPGRYSEFHICLFSVVLVRIIGRFVWLNGRLIWFDGLEIRFDGRLIWFDGLEIQSRGA